MIREYQEKDLNTILEIWLEASVKAHHFIPATYWKSKITEMKEVYIPSSKTYIYQPGDKTTGFISLVDNYIAAVFITPKCQRQGIGKQLIDFVKEIFSELKLTVYAENEPTIRFYRSQGFEIQSEQTDENTGHKEYNMRWKKA